MTRAEKSAAGSEKKKLIAAGAAVAATASLAVGGLFSSPADLLSQQAPTPVVLELTSDDAGEEPSGTEEEKQRGGVRTACRNWVQSLPLGVRALVGVPLWTVGWLLLSALSLLWTGLLSPVAGGIAGWLCLAALLLGVLTLTAKAMFPHMPLKKILNRRSVAGVLIGTALLAAADRLLPLVWDEYSRCAGFARACGSLLLLGVLLWALARRERKRERAEKRAAQETDEATLAERQERALRYVRSLADSVSGKGGD